MQGSVSQVGAGCNGRVQEMRVVGSGCLGDRGAANAPLPRVVSKHLEVSAGSSVGRDRQLRNAREERAEQWTTPALEIPFWESVHGEPQGNGRRAAPPPTDDRGLPIAAVGEAWARVARGAARRSVAGGAGAHPNPRSAEGPGFPGVAPAYRRMTFVESGRRRPCRSWRSYSPAGVEDDQSRRVPRPSRCRFLQTCSYDLQTRLGPRTCKAPS